MAYIENNRKNDWTTAFKFQNIFIDADSLFTHMTTESRERADNFYPADKDNHHWYDCNLCAELHLVDDDASAFRCPNVPDHKPNVILFHPNE